jgi:hypothetical protein
MITGTRLNVALAFAVLPPIYLAWADFHRALGHPWLTGIASVALALVLVFGTANGGARALANIGLSDKALRMLVAACWGFSVITMVGILTISLFAAASGKAIFEYAGNVLAIFLVISAFLSAELVVVCAYIGDTLDQRAEATSNEASRQREEAERQAWVVRVETEKKEAEEALATLQEKASDAATKLHEIELSSVSPTALRILEAATDWLPAGEIAKVIGAKNAIHVHLKHLHEKGLVERRNSEDARSRYEFRTVKAAT